MIEVKFMAYEVKYLNYYTHEPVIEKYHGNTNEEELDNKIYSKWKNYHQKIEIRIFKNEKLMRVYPKL